MALLTWLWCVVKRLVNGAPYLAVVCCKKACQWRSSLGCGVLYKGLSIALLTWLSCVRKRLVNGAPHLAVVCCTKACQ